MHIAACQYAILPFKPTSLDTLTTRVYEYTLSCKGSVCTVVPTEVPKCDRLEIRLECDIEFQAPPNVTNITQTCFSHVSNSVQHIQQTSESTWDVLLGVTSIPSRIIDCVPLMINRILFPCSDSTRYEISNAQYILTKRYGPITCLKEVDYVAPSIMTTGPSIIGVSPGLFILLPKNSTMIVTDYVYNQQEFSHNTICVQSKCLANINGHQGVLLLPQATMLHVHTLTSLRYRELDESWLEITPLHVDRTIPMPRPRPSNTRVFVHVISWALPSIILIGIGVGLGFLIKYRLIKKNQTERTEEGIPLEDLRGDLV